MSLSGFRKLSIAILTLQGGFVVISLMLCVSTMNRVSVVAEKQVQIAERQRVLEKKADIALQDASKALTISGKSEADIAWIREGFTEMKAMLRETMNERRLKQ